MGYRDLYLLAQKLVFHNSDLNKSTTICNVGDLEGFPKAFLDLETYTPMRCTPARYTPMRYTAGEMHAYEIHAGEMHACICNMDIWEVHVWETYVCKVQLACEYV